MSKRIRYAMVMACFITVMFGYLGEQKVLAKEKSESSITVDGYFDDWTNIPHGILTYGSWNGECNHQCALYQEGDYVYLHIRMHDLYGAQIPLNAYAIYINDVPVQFSAHFISASGGIDWGNDNTIYNLPLGTTTGIGVFQDNYPNLLIGELAYTSYEKDHSKGDEIELSLSLDVLSKITGIPKESISKIEIRGINGIGNGTIVSSGTSTGAFLGVGICILSVGGVILYRKKRQGEFV